MRRWRARQRVAAPVPPGPFLAVHLGGIVAVGRRRQGEGQGDDRLARRVEQLDLAALEVLPLGEGVHPRRSSQEARGHVRGPEHVGSVFRKTRIRREGTSSAGINSGFGKGRKRNPSLSASAPFISVIQVNTSCVFDIFDHSSPLTTGSPLCIFSALLFSSSTTITEKDGRTFTFNWQKQGGGEYK